MRVLGIETSCDETGIALYDSQGGLEGQALHSQVQLHAEFGGVVPELASRDHLKKLIPLIQQLNPASKPIDAIAYTAGPGLIGALLVGATFAKALALAWDIPAIAIHHLEGHLLAPFLSEPQPTFPFTALLVSGGHTLLVRVHALGQYTHLGETLDDAVGEAFDKTAKLLGLGYPGGPALAQLAESGNPQRFDFPRPMLDRPGLDFSFSGLKTFALNTWSKTAQTPQDKADIATAFQTAVVDTLLRKCQRALKLTQDRQLVVAGGVGANRALRQGLHAWMAKQGGQVFFPDPSFCTDNGAMIAYAGHADLSSKTPAELAVLRDDTRILVKARWPLSESQKI